MNSGIYCQQNSSDPEEILHVPKLHPLTKSTNHFKKFPKECIQAGFAHPCCKQRTSTGYF